MEKAPPSAFARAVGAGVASFMIALLVCGFTYALRELDFAPVRALVSQEDHLYDVFHSPDIHLRKNAHRVVFIDIDDEAVSLWRTPEGASSPGSHLLSNTPRKLIADLAHYARAANAKVVYLDFDFRDSLPGDEDLKAELGRKHATPILIPTFFSSGRLPPCDDQDRARPPTELQTVFSDLAKTGEAPTSLDEPSVVLVHPVLARGAYGLTEGACSSYRVRLEADGETVLRAAAMARAVEIANKDAPPCDPAEACVETPHAAKPALLPIRWTIGKDTDRKHDREEDGAEGGQALAYARVKASNLVAYQSVPVPVGDEADVLKDAIVVIGSTALWSEDTLTSPIGELQGALAHVNLALSLQAEDDEVPILVQLVLDVVFIALAAIATVWICWRPTFKAMAEGGELSMPQRILRIVFELVVFLACGLAFAAGCALLLRYHFGLLAGWRFGVLSFIVGAIVGLIIEICSVVAESAREWAEAYVTRRSGPVPQARSGGEASDGGLT